MKYIILTLFLFFLSCTKKEKKIDIPSSTIKDFAISAKKDQIEIEKKIINEYIKRSQKKWKCQGSICISLEHSRNGKLISNNDTILIKYKLSLINGKMCDSSNFNKYILYVVGKDYEPKGLQYVLNELKRGDCAWAIIPSPFAYGFIGDLKCVPPNTPVIYYLCVK